MVFSAFFRGNEVWPRIFPILLFEYIACIHCYVSITGKEMFLFISLTETRRLSFRACVDFHRFPRSKVVKTGPRSSKVETHPFCSFLPSRNRGQDE